FLLSRPATTARCPLARRFLPPPASTGHPARGQAQGPRPATPGRDPRPAAPPLGPPVRSPPPPGHLPRPRHLGRQLPTQQPVRALTLPLARAEFPTVPPQRLEVQQRLSPRAAVTAKRCCLAVEKSMVGSRASPNGRFSSRRRRTSGSKTSQEGA